MVDFKRFLRARKNVANSMRKTTHRKRGGGGGFGDRWFPPKTSEGDRPVGIVLFPGDYKIPVALGKKGEMDEMELQYYLTFEHYYAAKKRGATCSAGLRVLPDGDDFEITFGDNDCPACYHIEDGAGGINRRLMHVFNAVLLGHFHLVDSDRADDEGKPYKDWVNCEGKRCKYCSSGSDRIYGRRVYWPMGSRFVNTLMTQTQTVLSSHCKCGGEIEPIGFQCPECSEVFRDLEEDPADDEELKVLRTKKVRCPNCKVVDIPEEVPECDSCKKATPLTMWDVQYKLARQGEGTDTTLMISEWKPLTDKLLAKIERHMKPYDFAGHLYKPPTPAHQASRLGVPNPFSEKGDKGGVDWKGRDDDDEDDD